VFTTLSTAENQTHFFFRLKISMASGIDDKMEVTEDLSTESTVDDEYSVQYFGFHPKSFMNGSKIRYKLIKLVS